MVGQIGGETKAAELESRTDRAANERIFAKTSRCLPDAGRNDADRGEAPSRSAQHMPRELSRPWIVSKQQQRRAGIEMPDLVRIDDVPATELMLFEQVVDRSGRTSRLVAALNAIRRAIDFPKPAAFRMGGELQFTDHL